MNAVKAAASFVVVRCQKIGLRTIASYAPKVEKTR
jgi:hypothetical protein